MDLVYIVGADPHHEHIELRYSIRSMFKYLNGFDRIIIVGQLPPFFQNVIHIPFEDKHRHNADRNIYEKILAACNHPGLSENFCCCSDDYFLLKSFDLTSLPFYYCGTLEETFKKLSKENYYRSHVEATYNILSDRNLPTLNFNTHFPIVYNKQTFIDCMSRYNWETKIGYISKSLYCNSLKIPGEYMTDSKIHTPKTKTAIDRKLQKVCFFSTNEFSVNEPLKEVWQALYPESSPVEL
jgi:hypothetical protein